MEDIVIVISALALVLALASTGWSVARSLRKNRRSKYENLVPVARIHWAIVAGLILVAVPTLLIATPTDTVLILAATTLTAALIALITTRLLEKRHIA